MGAEPRDGGFVSAAQSTLADTAFAKVNLTLRILGKRADGYHEIDSLVAFAAIGDRLMFAPGGELSLEVGGPLAAQAGPDSDNLVIKAADALARQVSDLSLGKFTLTKFLPAQAGLGGGSADAAAALRLLARANGLAPDDPRLHQAARETGADVPVCLDPQPRWMRGIGEVLSAPVSLPRLPAVLVRPDVALATRDVFAALKAAPLTAQSSTAIPDLPTDAAGLVHFVTTQNNDLERPANLVAPQVVEVLSSLRLQPMCLLARMSGSGSACFGLFGSPQSASDAARSMVAAHPAWWVQATTIGTVL
jgi:4-diphosphocytidyl-2-C-methyl-D-erythritol kinase